MESLPTLDVRPDVTISKTPVRILHVISGDLWAGAEVQAHTLLCALQQIPGVELAVVLMNDGELAARLRSRRVHVEILDENAIHSWAIGRGLRRFMRAWKPDVVHTHRVKENILGAWANHFATRAPSLRTVHGASEHHGSGLQGLKTAVLNRLNRWAGVHLQDRIIAVSDDLAVKLRAEFPADRIVVIENGIDVEATRAAVKPVEFRSQPDNATHVGIVGRLVPVKRVDLFIDICVAIKHQAPERQWQFHILGDGPLRTALEAQAAERGVASDIRFHGHRADILSCIAALDALVMCSDHEGLPMTALESVALGTPLVAHAVGELCNLLRGRPESRLVDAHEAHRYAEAVIAATRTAERKLAPLDLKYTARANATAVYEIYRNLQAKFPHTPRA